MQTQVPTLTLEQYESLNPYRTVMFEGRKVHYLTPSTVMKWRTDTLFTKEPDTIRWLSCMHAEDTLFDIGANVGMYTLLAAVGRGVSVIACEPESQNFALLNKNIKTNGVNDSVQCFCLALSDTVGFDDMYLSQFEAGGSCHMVGESVDINLQPRDSAYVQGCIVTTVDQFIVDRSINVPTHIKIDVDGIEHKVIEGMLNTLDNIQLKSVLVELNPNIPQHLAIFDVFSAKGFSYFSSQAGESHQSDGVFKGMGNVIFYRPGWSEYEKLFEQQKYSISIMSIFSQVFENINKTNIESSPSPHFYIEDVFPEEFYSSLLENLPLSEIYKPISEGGLTSLNSYPDRSIFQLEYSSLEKLPGKIRPFWTQIANILLSSEFMQLILSRFLKDYSKVFQIDASTVFVSEALLIKDTEGYELGPHTDSPDRVVSLLFYLPNNDDLISEGTAFYLPKEKGYTCSTGEHHSFDAFTEVSRLPFKPNSLMGFIRTESSFHGVPAFTQQDKERNLLGYTIRKLK